MRIPLLVADFERGTFTKIAKSLRKIWPLGDQSLMQSQNTLGVLMGYNGLHDAQREASAAFSFPDGLQNMKRFDKAIAWRMFVRYGIDLLTARALTSRLHLNELAVASFTMEGKLRQLVENAGTDRVFLDEAWDLMSHREAWLEQTPQLLGSGVAPYKWAIYPDQTVFLWSKLVEQIDMLPEGYVEDLREAGKLGTSTDPGTAFVLESLVPAARQSLRAALTSGALTPAVGGKEQWQVKWIVNRAAEVLGCCIVAERLGGMIPRVFSPDGADAYAALATLLCGGLVPPADSREVGTLVSDPVWFIERSRLQRLRDGKDSDLLKTLWHHDKWPAAISLHRCETGCRLSGTAEFSECGQAYLATTTFDADEQRRMLREVPVFETFVLGPALLNAVASDTGIPAAGNRWHDAIADLFSTRTIDVEAAMSTPAGVHTLMSAVLTACNVPDLDAFAVQAINEYFPLRYEGESDDSEDLLNERRNGTSLLEKLGESVIASMPGLQAYSPASLGYFALAAKAEYPGSRYQSMVDAPAREDWAAQSRLLASMLIYEVQAKLSVSPTALACAIAPVLGLGSDCGEWSKDRIMSWCRSACAVERRLKEAGRQLKDVADWREIEVAAARIHASGEYLRAGDRIPVTRPKSPQESLDQLYSKSRSRGVGVIHATQDTSNK